MDLTVTSIDGSRADAWDAYVRRRPDASFYHLYGWRAFFAEHHRKETHYLMATGGDGSTRGVLPLVRQRSWLFGDYLVSLPFVNYGGAVADDHEAREHLVRGAANLARELGVSHVEFRDSQTFPGLAVRTDKVSMRLPLPRSEEELARGLGSKLRAQVKRALRESVSVEVGSAELVDRFYQVFSRNMRDLGTPVYSRRTFIDILARFPAESCIVLVSVAGRPAAAGLLLTYAGTTEIPWASSIRRYNPLSVNMLLYWEALKHSIGRGSHTFDFGRSSVDSGTYRFKKQWGAKPHQLYWHYWLRDGFDVPALNPQNRKFSLAIRAWRRLPVWAANAIGPLLVRNLP